MLFSVLAVPTGTLVLPKSTPLGTGNRGLMMAARRRTRAADYTIPQADGGPTHASNLKCYCRTHHLPKTTNASAPSTAKAHHDTAATAPMRPVC